MAALQELSKVQDMLDSEVCEIDSKLFLHSIHSEWSSNVVKPENRYSQEGYCTIKIEQYENPNEWKHGSAVKLEFSTQNTSEVKSGEKPALGENPEWLHMVKTETQSFTDNKKQHAEFASVVKTERKLQDICVKMEQNLGHAESTEQPAAASSKSKIHSCKEVNTAIKMEQEVGNHRYMKVDNIKLEGSLEQQDNQRQLSQVVPSCKIEAVTMCLNLVTAQKISGTKCRMNILRDSDQHQQQTCCDLSEVMDGVTLNVFIDVANSDFNQNEIKCLESDTENDLDVSCEKSHAEEDCHLQVTLGQKRDTDFLECICMTAGSSVVKKHTCIYKTSNTSHSSEHKATFRQASEIDNQMVTNRKIRTHQCDVCLTCFKSSVALQRHMYIHSSEKSHQCTACKSAFRTALLLKRHMVMHKTEKSDQDRVCKAAAKSSPCLKHRVNHSEGRHHECSVCKAAFKNVSHLNRHMAIHSDLRTHRCSQCRSAFRTHSDLKDHMLVHSSVKSHQCDLCQAAFKRSKHLTQHMLVHTEVKTQLCGVCKAAFRRPSDLKRHILVHGDLKPYHCSICKAAFKRSSHLQRHHLTHSDSHPYKCNVCNASFKRSANLKKHVVVHAEEV